MAQRTITAMFDRYADAARAVERLKASGISNDEISIVSNDATERDRYGTDTDTAEAAGTGAGTGAGLGAAVGGGVGLLAGLGLLAIPGIGPVVAGGWLASTALGAAVGAGTGGLVGALTGAGIEESHAHTYAEGIRRGGTLVTVRTDDAKVASVSDILDDEGTIDLAEREQAWRKDGWTGSYTGEGEVGQPTLDPGRARDATNRGDRIRTYPPV